MMFAFLFAAATVAQPCILVHADKITGRDLASASAVYAAVNAHTFVAYTPAPGRSRTFRPEELKRFADVPDAPSVCFEWAVEALEADKLMVAMTKALGVEGAEIEILAYSREPVPAGEVIFALQGLPSTPIAGGAVTWRGQVRYGGNRRCDIWARVKVSVPYSRVIAVSAIQAGAVVGADAVRVEQGRGMPSLQPFAVEVSEVVGRVARRSFAEGAAIPRTGVSIAPEIRKGDSVQIQVQSGATRLQIEGRAESSGGVGDSVAVRNPSSGKVFRARVERAGVVMVDAGSGK